jgi:hypothetical protein
MTLRIIMEITRTLKSRELNSMSISLSQELRFMKITLTIQVIKSNFRIILRN